jgi:hypothetical protein
MSRRVVACLVLVLLVACGTSPRVSTEVDSGVRGVVLAGPQCPVESTTSPCPDRPWVGKVEASDGAVRTERDTDAAGHFEIALEPGTWTLTPVMTGAMPSARPVTVTVRPHAFVTVRLVVDTGIR